MSERKPVRLNLGEFKPKSPTIPIDSSRDDVAVRTGERLGFTAGAGTTKVDGRTLRRKGKLQTNMKLSERVRRDFLQLTQKFGNSDECLAYLLSLHDQATKIADT